MPNLIFAISGAAGVILLITGLCFRILKTACYGIFCSIKNRNTGLLEYITSRKNISRFLDFLAGKHNIKSNKFALKLLELSEAGISLQQVYFLKISCLIVSTVLGLVLGYTNMTYQEKVIVETSQSGKLPIMERTSPGDSRFVLYRQIEDKLNETGRFHSAEYREKYDIIQRLLAKKFNTSDKQFLEENTQWFLNSFDKIQKIKLINSQQIFIVLSAFFLPELILIIRWLLKGCVYKREIIKLEYIFSLLARVDGIKTLDIIYELEKSSKIYSRYLREFSHIFIYDRKGAFEYLKNRNAKGLKRMANILEVYSLADKDIALQTLEREVIERDEAIMITADETVDFIDLIAFLSIIPLVYELARLMLNPMIDMVYRAFEFI